MVIKLYISGISGNKEVKKKQQRVQMILDSKQIDYEAIDITEPGKEKDKEFMQQNGKVRESLGKHPLPPQIFNEEDFCGDYEDFDLANEVDELEKFLHIETNSKDIENDKQTDCKSEASINDEKSEKSFDPYQYHTFKIKWDNVNGLEERIITNLVGENEQSEEITKSEVNGESEAVPPSEVSDSTAEQNAEGVVEEALAPEKEEAPSTDDKTADESTQEKNDEAVEDNNQPEGEAEAEEKKEEQEEEEAVESSAEAADKEDKNDEESPHAEEEGEGENVEKETTEEKVESEKEEEVESEEDSPQSEKSQED